MVAKRPCNHYYKGHVEWDQPHIMGKKPDNLYYKGLYMIGLTPHGSERTSQSPYKESMHDKNTPHSVEGPLHFPQKQYGSHA